MLSRPRTGLGGAALKCSSHGHQVVLGSCWLAWGSRELRMDREGSFLRDALTSTANRFVQEASSLPGFCS